MHDASQMTVYMNKILTRITSTFNVFILQNNKTCFLKLKTRFLIIYYTQKEIFITKNPVFCFTNKTVPNK